MPYIHFFYDVRKSQKLWRTYDMPQYVERHREAMPFRVIPEYLEVLCHINVFLTAL
jgi:hypothetical protein